MSKEHYVSENMLRVVSLNESRVLVRNLQFQPPDTQERLGTGHLAAYILCEKHNNDLSPFDTAGGNLVSGMDQIDRAAGKVDEKAETIELNGDDLERCMLKMLCGGLFSGNFGRGVEGVYPPREWLEILFRNAKMPLGHGLYVRAGTTPGVVFATDPAILKVEVVDSPTNVIGFRMLVFNFEFVLVLAGLPPQRPQMLEYTQYRPRGIVVQGSNKRIRFCWQEAAGNELIVKWVGGAEESN
jgi:hypothetical protein